MSELKPMKRLVILQSNYLPWLGYFDLMRRADMFVILDVVQYTKNDWRNRNRIRTPQGPHWLTIPVNFSLSAATPIDEVQVAKHDWADKHIDLLRQFYRRSGAYVQESPWLFEELNSLAAEPLLSKINTCLLTKIAKRLGIGTPVAHSSSVLDRDELIAMGSNERLLALCAELGATHYLSGPAAKAYLDVERFAASGVQVEWMSYEGYAPYAQAGEGFEPRLSVVDALLNLGKDALSCLPQLKSTG
jgi:WbqC-like protein family